MKYSCRQVSTNGDENIIPPNPPLLKGGRGDFQRKYKWIIVFFILTGIAALVYGLSGGPHEFTSGQCTICHINEKNEPMNIKPAITLACESCHTVLRETQSHPTDMYPSLSIPKDLPLIEGRLTCITCHYVHPKQKKGLVKKPHFLRRLVRGPLFCSICHVIDEKQHIVLENIHSGSYEVTDNTTRIDMVSLECIECHDAYINEPVDFLGAGRWDHFSKKLEHPIGIRYEEISTIDNRNYRPVSMLSKEITLFDGKIGCGTCHNIYSKERFMLVMENIKSRLCLECHIK